MSHPKLPETLPGKELVYLIAEVTCVLQLEGNLAWLTWDEAYTTLPSSVLEQETHGML